MKMESMWNLAFCLIRSMSAACSIYSEQYPCIFFGMTHKSKTLRQRALDRFKLDVDSHAASKSKGHPELLRMAERSPISTTPIRWAIVLAKDTDFV